MNELRESNIGEFKAHFRGDVLVPGNAGYDEVREFSIPWSTAGPP